MTDSQRCLDKACDDGPREEDAEPRPRWASDGLLCLRCRTLLERRVAELPARLTALRLTLLHGTTAGASLGNSRTKGTPPLPSRGFDGTHDLLTATHALLVSWSLLVREERGVRGPDSSDPTALAPFLLSWLDWIVEQPWVDDLADEVRDATRAADRANGVTLRWHRLTASCPHCGAHELGRWDGAAEVQCASCEAFWPEDEYPRLVRMLADGHTVTAAEAVRTLGVSSEVFRQYVSRGKVRRVGTVDGQARYVAADVEGLRESA